MNTFSGLKSGADSDSIIRFTTTTTVDSSSTTESKLEDILSIKPAALLVAFVRVRKQKENWEKWKPPIKGTIKKVEQGLVCSSTGEKFLILQVKEIATTQPDILAISPNIPVVTIPLAIALPEPSMVHFGEVSTLDKFKFLADKEWCLKASDAILSIKLKESVDTLTMNQESLDALNRNAFRFARMILARLPSFVSTRVSNKIELFPGNHWHWDSFISKLPRIALLFALSGHICDNLESRGAHESYLQHDPNEYLKFEDELEKADGVYFFRDDRRGTIIRAGMSDNECKT